MWEAGHTMAVRIAMSLIWIGVLLHQYPVITGRTLNRALGNWFVTLHTVGAMGVAWSFLAAGASGKPRHFAAWYQEGWMFFGYLILIFGLCRGASLFVLGLDLKKSLAIAEITPAGQGAPAE